MSGLNRSIHHVAVAVRVLDDALAFWRDKLCLPLKKRAVVPDQGVEVALLALANSHIELIQPLDASNSVSRFIERRGEALHHVCLTTPDIVAEMADLRARGVELIDEAPREGIAGRVCFLHPRAMAGVLVELVEARAGLDGEAPLLRLDAVTALVLDIEAAGAAWRSALGLGAEPARAFDEAAFEFQNASINLFQPPDIEGEDFTSRVGLRTIHLALDDFDAELERLHDLGLEFFVMGNYGHLNSASFDTPGGLHITFERREHD